MVILLLCMEWNSVGAETWGNVQVYDNPYSINRNPDVVNTDMECYLTFWRACDVVGGGADLCCFVSIFLYGIA